MLDITFETAAEPQTFAHLTSDDGVWGHGAEIKAKVPVGTWVTVEPRHQPALTWWLCKHAGFTYHGIIRSPQGFDDLLRRE